MMLGELISSTPGFDRFVSKNSFSTCNRFNERVSFSNECVHFDLKRSNIRLPFPAMIEPERIRCSISENLNFRGVLCAKLEFETVVLAS